MKNNMKNNLKNTILAALLLISLTITTSSNAQVGIGVTTANMAASAELDVTSTTKGFLPPRMNTVQRNAIVNPGAGLIIYCTDCGSNGGEAEFYNGSAWVSMYGLQGSLPTLAPTSSTSAIGFASATSGGNILADGGAPVCFRGVCWGTTSNPTIALSTKTTDGTGIGAFTSAITGLTDNTTFYVRSYATNTVGTAYGNEEVFTTLQLMVPTISTSAVSDLTYSTATTGGTMTNDGGSVITARGVCWSTSSNPTIALSTKTMDGTGTGAITNIIRGLTENTTYYVRSYATNAIGTAYGNELVFTTTPDLTPRVTIGTQVWTTVNLNVSTYRDGTPVPEVRGAADWTATTYGAYCYYLNNSANGPTYGKLYNWEAIKDTAHGGLAPAGYHIPTKAEWTTLVNYLGGEAVAGDKMKEAGHSHWNPTNLSTNSSGFSGLPGGARSSYDGSFWYIGLEGNYMSSSDDGIHPTSLWICRLYHNLTSASIRQGLKLEAYSVRCVKD